MAERRILSARDLGGFIMLFCLNILAERTDLSPFRLCLHVPTFSRVN